MSEVALYESNMSLIEHICNRVQWPLNTVQLA